MPQENKTPEEILKENVYPGFKSNYTYDSIIKSMKEYGKQEFNRAIELAAENAVDGLCEKCNGTGYYEDVELEAVCCGNVDKYGWCCNNPDAYPKQVLKPCACSALDIKRLILNLLKS